MGLSMQFSRLEYCSIASHSLFQGLFSGRILACQTGGPGSIPGPAARVPFRASLVAQTVKNPPAMQETRDHSLGWEDALEKRMATHFSILAWRIPWTEEPGGLQSMGSQRVRHD